MAIIVKDEPSPEAGIDMTKAIVPQVNASPVLVLLRNDVREKFLAELNAEVDAFEPCLETKKDRDAIATFAFKFTRSKTAIKEAAKEFTDGFYKKIAVVNATRDDMADELDKLRDRARAPLTEWEKEEKERLRVEAEKAAAIKAKIDEFERMAVVIRTDTAEMVARRLDRVKSMADETATEPAKSKAIAALTEAHERIVKEEADRAELEKLRAEAAELKRAAAQKPEDVRAKQITDDERAKFASHADTPAISPNKLPPLATASTEQIGQSGVARTPRDAAIIRAKNALMDECFGIDSAAADEVIDAIANGLIPHVTFDLM